MCAQLCLSFVTPWTKAHQAPLSMEFPGQEYWNGLSFLSPGDLPNPGLKSVPPAWHADSSPLHHLASGITVICPNSIRRILCETINLIIG